MITIPVSVSIDNDSNGIPKGTPPYTFVFSSNNSSCVSFSNVTGTCALIGNKYTALTDVEYVNQTCIGTSLITCVITDANGCSVTKSPLVIDDPCDIQTSISTNGEFVFVATTTGGSGYYTYEWSWDKFLFEKQADDTEDDDNIISLKLRAYEKLPLSTIISVKVTDSQGCIKQASYTYSFCQPLVNISRRIALVCDTTPVSGCTTPVSQYRNLDISNDFTLCAGQTLDWSTLTLGIPSGLCVNHNGSGILTISSTLSSTSTKAINFSIKTTSGVRSTLGIITVTIPTCSVSEILSGSPQTSQLTINEVVSDVVTIPVEPRVAGNPNWSTFTFTNTPSWGTVTFNANREIEYEITNIATTPTIPDVIKWSLNDYSGNQINITDTILRDRIALPILSGDIVCVTCGETSDPVDVLANDTGDIDRSTLTLTSVDSDIVVTKDSDNNLIFTVLPTVASFSNICQYKVANTQGAFSSTANIAVTTACSGIPQNYDLTCEVSKTFDLIDRFLNPLGLNWTLTETTTTAPTYITQGGSIVNPNSDGTVDFTGIATNRTYTFQLATENTASCPGVFDYQEVEIFHGVTPHITFGTAVDNGNGTSTYPLTYSGLASSLIVTLNGNPASFQTAPLLSNGSGTFTIYNVAGLNTVVASATNLCGVTINDTDATLTI